LREQSLAKFVKGKGPKKTDLRAGLGGQSLGKEPTVGKSGYTSRNLKGPANLSNNVPVTKTALDVGRGD